MRLALIILYPEVTGLFGLASRGSKDGTVQLICGKLDFRLMYLSELLAEQRKLTPFMPVLPHSFRLLHQGEFPACSIISTLVGTIFSKQCIFSIRTPPEGRLLGPRGNSLKRVEASTECRVLIRGRGSIKDLTQVTVIFFHHLHWSAYLNLEVR
ncbi:hypothetical protein ACLOJK_041578 [Asimina triloba]